VLGYVSTISSDIRFELPATLFATSTDIEKVHIALVPVVTFDHMVPVYIDHMWLEVEYKPTLELGVLVHSSSSVPVYSLADIVMSETATSTTDVSSSTPFRLTESEFTSRLTKIHGIDNRYAFVTLTPLTSTSSLPTTTAPETATEPLSLWLFDTKTEHIHILGEGKTGLGLVAVGVKDSMLFWITHDATQLLVYDLRTGGTLHQIDIVGNLPDEPEHAFAFTFTDWKLIWRGNELFFDSTETGEVFSDEQTEAAEYLYQRFALTTTLPYESLHNLGGVFIPESAIE
jgi:hypothetical protein